MTSYEYIILSHCCLDLSLTMQKSSIVFDNDRSIDIYFPPVIPDGKSACLQMNFTTFAHFAVKLAYVHERQYKERKLFRSLKSLGEEPRYWRRTITSDMTEGEEFVVVLHAQNSLLGTMAVINSINLGMDECYETGKCYVSHFIFGILSCFEIIIVIIKHICRAHFRRMPQMR